MSDGPRTSQGETSKCPCCGWKKPGPCSASCKLASKTACRNLQRQMS